MKPIACTFAIALALLGALLPSMAKAQSLQTAALRSDGIAWITQPQDILQALHQAENAGSPVMIYFHADWCPYCQQMEENTFSDDDVQALSERFACIR
ncbi:MAG TPA: thioredoxin family protein, partial [Chthonomonadaceae bacterium]|nr:thioredoxin family protein [Chthonomonadaceae bacterium]